MEGKTNERPLLQREHPDGGPATGYDSKIVMLRAERHDIIDILDVVTELSPGLSVPDEASVVRRTSTYYGPKLLVESNGRNYLITAPGPDVQLLLWSEETGAEGFREKWIKNAEITAQFSETRPQYDLCPICGEPMQTLEHEREAAFGVCPNDEL